MERKLIALGRRLRAQQDEDLGGSVDFERGRRRLLDAARRRGRPSATVVALGAATATAALALAFAVIVGRPAALRFQVGEDGQAGQDGQYGKGGVPGRPGAALVAGAREVPLLFSDGTRLLMAPGAETQVADLDAGPRVVLVRGVMHATVVPQRGRRWRIEAGPFEVRVTGTQFDVGWDPATRQFSLTLREGKVLVSGPGVGVERPVKTGETLSASAGSPEPDRSSPASVVPHAAEGGSAAIAGPPEAPAPAPVVTPIAPHRSPAHPPSAPVAQPTGSPRFVALARQNRFAEALADAVAQGFGTLCETADVAELILLGDAARLAGDPVRAQAAYAAVRARARGAAAAHAAFMLGRMALWGRGDYAEAARLFEACVREAPDGPFAREATGLMVEALAGAGDVDGARVGAARYLDRYPDGPFAAKARSLRDGE